MLSSVLELANLEFVFAGHGLDLGGDGGSDGDGADGGGGTIWIVAGIVLGVVGVGYILLSLGSSGVSANVRRFGPKALILILITAPLIAWTAWSTGSDEESLIVERWTNDAGAPELIVSLREDDLNTLETNNGKSVVQLECVDDEGEVLLAATPKWPFVYDRGYDHPHMHQAASREQLLRADSCSLRGTHVALEADVKGVLTK